MYVKRTSGVSIRRVNRQPITTRDRLEALVVWMNTNLTYLKKTATTAQEYEGQMYNYGNRITSAEMNIAAIEELMEDVLE